MTEEAVPQEAVRRIRKWVDSEDKHRRKEERVTGAKRAKDLIAAFAVGNGVLDRIAPRQRYPLDDARNPPR